MPEAVYKADPSLVKFTARLTKPWIQHGTHYIESLTDGFCSDLDQIDVLGVSGWWFKIDLVQGGTAAKDKAVCDFGDGKRSTMARLMTRSCST